MASRISEQEYRKRALHEPDHRWELQDGVPRTKPAMSMKHDDVATDLGAAFIGQLDLRVFRVTINGGKTRILERNAFIPDVVMPTAHVQPFEHDPRAFNAHADPFPIVIEAWSLRSGDEARRLSRARR